MRGKQGTFPGGSARRVRLLGWLFAQGALGWCAGLAVIRVGAEWYGAQTVIITSVHALAVSLHTSIPRAVDISRPFLQHPTPSEVIISY